MRKIPLKRVGKRKQSQLEQDVEEMKELARRAGGLWVVTGKGLYGGFISGGVCECGCNLRASHDYNPMYNLHPHEVQLKRSKGGRVSLENSILVLNAHHPD